MNLGHDLLNLFALFLENVQVRPVKLGRKSAFCAGQRFVHVVFNGLGEIPESPGIFLKLAIHRGDQFIFVLMKNGPPLFLGLQVHEIFRIAESSRVGSVVGRSGLRDDRGDFGERSEDVARLSGEAFPFRETRAVRHRAAGPNRAFIEMGQELRADDAAEREDTSPPAKLANPTPIVTQRWSMACRTALRYRLVRNAITGLCHSLTPLLNNQLAQHRCDKDRVSHGAEKSEGNGPGHRLE